MYASRHPQRSRNIPPSYYLFSRSVSTYRQSPPTRVEAVRLSATIFDVQSRESPIYIAAAIVSVLVNLGILGENWRIQNPGRSNNDFVIDLVTI